MNHVSQLPFLPISSNMLAEAPFFLSKDARIVRAGFWMLEAAWRSEKPGSIPANFASLASITRLTESEVQGAYDVLTDGWEVLDDGRLHHHYLAKIIESVQERFGPQLAVIADSAVLACQGGVVEFDLMPAVEVAKKKRGKHALPKDFQVDRVSLEKAVAEGYTSDEHQAWLLQSFRDFAESEDRRYANWNATLRNFIGNPYTVNKFKAKFGHLPGHLPQISLVADVGRALTPAERLRGMAPRSNPQPAALTSFAQRTAAHNSNMMASGFDRLDSRADRNLREEPFHQAPGMS